jgi:prepilin-type N-terminal cleavage/methylation domain-containing protein
MMKPNRKNKIKTTFFNLHKLSFWKIRSSDAMASTALFGKSDRGFTLIETMIALLVLSIGILGLLTLSVTSIKMDFKARRMTEGTTLNADRQEKLMLAAYDALAAGAGGPIVDGKYTTSWNVSGTGVPISNVKTITITTQWQENGQMRSVQYVYYKAETF